MCDAAALSDGDWGQGLDHKHTGEITGSPIDASAHKGTRIGHEEMGMGARSCFKILYGEFIASARGRL